MTIPKRVLQRRVVCSAIKLDSKVILGVRHFDAFMRQQIPADTAEDWFRAEQGFVDQFGVFLTREEAMAVALEANQLVRRVGGDSKKLFSENLY